MPDTNIKDQLGSEGETIQVGIWDIREKIKFEEGTTIIGNVSNGNTWQVGSATNAIVGAWTGTLGGGQLVVGVSHITPAITNIVNPNNTFREHFRDTTFKDSPTTANWDTTNFRIAMSTSNNHSVPYNTVATFKSIFFNSQTVSSVTLNCTETKWNPNEVISYFISADGGNTWEEVVRGTEHAFTVQGQDLRLKVVMFGNGGVDTYIEDLQVSYGI